MNDVEFMKTTLLAMQHETDSLRKIISRLIQLSTLMERLQRIAVDLESVLEQLKWQESPTEHPASQSKLTVQEFYQRRQVALEQHRKKFEKENGNRYMEHRSDDAAEDKIDCV